jgi:hypothetical protein
MLMLDLPLVGSVSACAKCGRMTAEGGVAMHFHTGVPYPTTILPTSTRWWPCNQLLHEMPQETGEDAIDNREAIGEHICRVCTRCGHGWVERPADSEQPVHLGEGANADECPACSLRTDLVYPFLCPGDSGGQAQDDASV